MSDTVTVSEFAKEFDEPEEKVERLLVELEADGVVELAGEREYRINSTTKALKFLWANREKETSPFPAVDVL